MDFKGSSIPDRENPIGGYVRAARKGRGLTQQQLAEIVGVGTRFLSELERGKPSLRRDGIEKVLAAFGKRLGVVDAPREDVS